MKRSKSIQLILVSTIPFALAACDSSVQQAVRTVTDKRSFETVQSCVDSKIPADICADAYMGAMALHRKEAPTYDTQTNCEADFIAGYCAAITGGQFMPKLGGFQITSDREEVVPVAAGQANQAGSGHSGGSNDGLLTGLLLGQMMSGGGARYYSEPVYISRDSRGSFSNSTLAKQVEGGSTFSRSQQASKGGNYAQSTTKSSSMRDALSRSKSTAAVASVTRGGFGSQASARSGWGGSSGSFGG
jgi:uncharacterized protein YgiB involved in biofilm formation